MARCIRQGATYRRHDYQPSLSGGEKCIHCDKLKQGKRAKK